MKTGLFRRHDLLLIAALLSIALISYIVLRLIFSGEGSTVRVTVDGVTAHVYTLGADGEYTLTGYTGGICTMSIRDGSVTMTSADCPDKICVHHRPISHPGEAIICLPNRVVITIEGESDRPMPDAVTGKVCL